MKRCPKCDSVFSPTERFCEFDGTPLVAADPETSEVVSDEAEQGVHDVAPVAAVGAGRRPRLSWQKTLIIVVIADTVLGVVLFLVFRTMTGSHPPENSGELTAANSSVIEQPGAPRFSPASPLPSPSPSIEPSPSPSAAPSPSPSPQPANVELSSSPISTGGDGKTKRGPVIIRLTEGGSIEADEVWQTGEGLWYRRGTLVALLASTQVKTIEKVAAVTPQPSVSTNPSP